MSVALQIAQLTDSWKQHETEDAVSKVQHGRSLDVSTHMMLPVGRAPVKSDTWVICKPSTGMIRPTHDRADFDSRSCMSSTKRRTLFHLIAHWSRALTKSVLLLEPRSLHRAVGRLQRRRTRHHRRPQCRRRRHHSWPSVPQNTAPLLTVVSHHTASYLTAVPHHTASYLTAVPHHTASYLTAVPHHTASYLTAVPHHTASLLTAVRHHTASSLTAVRHHTASLLTAKGVATKFWLGEQIHWLLNPPTPKS